MNKGRRVELRNLKFKKRLKQLGLVQKKPTDFTCFKDQGKPCSCHICSYSKYNRAKQKNLQDIDI